MGKEAAWRLETASVCSGRAPFRSVVHACAMGTEGFPVVSRIAHQESVQGQSSSEELGQRLEKRFHCTCHFHALLNFLTFSCQRNTLESLPGFLCECSRYLLSGDRKRRSYADFIA